ncbi:MAG: hypothetical protein Q7S42_06505 [Candidatus Omnitrophota bacterium]|nr:hypothetical protein [Candidatus Omnitrophota bacterium]
MKLKSIKTTLILVISTALTMSLLFPAIAADNSYSVRISCIIPAITGKNIPILPETRITNTREQINSPVILQKDTQEIRISMGKKVLSDVETLYSR